MRLASRIDDNQVEIVKALREVGATVQPLHAVGAGCPDILVGFRGTNLLMEIKDGSKSPSRRKLTPDQVAWHGHWFGQVAIVNSVQQAIDALNGEKHENY